MDKDKEIEELRVALAKCLFYADCYYLKTGDEGAHQAVLMGRRMQAAPENRDRRPEGV